MLEFREINYQNDVPDIVNLISKGLDKEYTEDFFRWKHLENPFGKSFGLVATDNGKIVGLRMFMFWKFTNKKENKIITAIRPVDTVVDNAFRGKGLFKKLTLQGLDKCAGKYDIIFNTPNENSLPGYLKMGWEKVLTNHFEYGLKVPFFSSGYPKNLGISKFPDFPIAVDQWETLRDEIFLKWRYKNGKYHSVVLKSAGLIYSLDKLGFLNQIIIQEIFGETEDKNKLLSSLCRKYSTIFIYFYSNFHMHDIKFLYKRKRKHATVVQKNDTYGISGNLILSLGDLEGKL